MPTRQDDSIRTFVGHTEGVTSVDFAPDGYTALSGSWVTPAFDFVKQWDVATGKEIGVKSLSSAFKAYSGDIQAPGAFTSLAFAPGGRAALISWYGTELFLAHAPTGEFQTLEGHLGPILSVAFAPDGRTALSGSSDKTLKLWDLGSGKEIRTFQHSHGVSAIAFDGRYALSGDNEILKLWNVGTGEEIETFKGHTSVINSVAFGRGVALWTALSGSADGTLKLWQVDLGKELLTFKGHLSEVLSVAISPDGRTALSGSRDGTLKLWDVYTGKEIRTLKGHSDWVQSLTFAPGGRTALSGSQDKTLKLWDVS